MKKLVLFIQLLFVAQVCFAQCNLFYPMRENVQFEYDHFDKKDKLTLRTINSFKDVSTSGKRVSAKMVQEIIDAKKNKLMGTSETEWVCEDGILNFTVNSMSMMDGQQSQDAGVKVAVTGDKMDLPSILSVGQTLRDMRYNIKMDMSGLSMMNRDFVVKDRRVEAQEKVTTPAGTFDCFKITFTTTSEKGLGSGIIKTAMWYAKDAGLVKSENYKADGTLTTRQVLTKLIK